MTTNETQSDIIARVAQRRADKQPPYGYTQDQYPPRLDFADDLSQCHGYSPAYCDYCVSIAIYYLADDDAVNGLFPTPCGLYAIMSGLTYFIANKIDRDDPDIRDLVADIVATMAADDLRVTSQKSIAY